MSLQNNFICTYSPYLRGYLFDYTTQTVVFRKVHLHTAADGVTNEICHISCAKKKRGDCAQCLDQVVTL